MTLREYINEKYGLSELHDFKCFYRQVIADLGFENVARLIPAEKEELKKKYAEDVHFNNIPLYKWDAQELWVRRCV